MKKGFTLIEIMIVISIIATLMATSIYPNFSFLTDMEKRSGLTDHAQNMMSFISQLDTDLQKSSEISIQNNVLNLVLADHSILKYQSFWKADHEETQICRLSAAEKKCYQGLSFQTNPINNVFFQINYTLHYGKRQFLWSEVHNFAK